MASQKTERMSVRKFNGNSAAFNKVRIFNINQNNSAESENDDDLNEMIPNNYLKK